MEPIIIGLCGKKQTGKSTSCKFIGDFSRKKDTLTGEWTTIERLSFASKLKRMTADIFGVDYQCLIGTDEQKDSPTYLNWDNVACHIQRDFRRIDIIPNLKITHRELLQLVGTNLFRAIRPNIWVECLQRSIIESSADIIIVDDARFPNELEALRKSGGYLVKIYRNVDSPNAANHSSETALDHLDDKYYDFVITDEGNRTMEDLKNSWIAIMNELIGE